MVFYWFRYMDTNGKPSLCFGEGPNADKSDFCDVNSIDKIPFWGMPEHVGMYGIAADAFFQYGGYPFFMLLQNVYTLAYL